MEALFLKLVNMSITASWLVLAIIAVRFLFKKAPKWILCLLWGLVAFRLICPFSFESSMSLIPSTEPLPQEIIYTAQPEIHSGVPVIDQTVNPILESSMTPAELTSANPTQIWSFILSQVWILGMVLMFSYTLVSYLLLKRKVATAIPLVKGIKQSEYVDSPFVLGIIRPVIYLPFGMAEGDMAYVIAHEKAHIHRRDHWWKPLGFLFLSVYWFNPVLWVAYILLCRDIEAACDEKVIKDMEKNERRAYSTALLNCSVHRRRIAACPLAFGEVGVKVRVKGVMNYKKPAFWVVLTALVVSIVVAVCFLTNPESKLPITMGAGYVNRTTAELQFYCDDNLETAEYEISEAYSLEVLTEGKWKALTKLTDREISEQIVEVESYNANYDAWSVLRWEDYYGRLPDGTYRIRKDITISKGYDDTKTHPLYVEFTIGGTAEAYITYTLEDITPTGANLYEHETVDDSVELVYNGDEGFWLEVLQDGRWEYMEPTENVESLLPKDKHYFYGNVYPSSHIELDWSSLYGALPGGTYRLAREITHTAESDLRLCAVYAEFTIQSDSGNHIQNEVTMVPGRALSLNEVILLSQQGRDLTFDDFLGYAYEEQSNTRTYPINEAWHLLIHHDGESEKPISILLTHTDSCSYVDITKGNGEEAITDFITTQNPEVTERIVCLDIWTKKHTCLSSQKQKEELLTLLHDVQKNMQPASEAALAQAQADDFNTNFIEINYEIGKKTLCFSEDFRILWELGSAEGYMISGPEPLQRYVSTVMDGVRDKETSGEPFATMDTPWDWCANINQSAVASAKLQVCLYTYSSGNSSGASSTIGVISYQTLQELIKILNQIPASAIAPGSVLSKENYDSFFFNQQAQNASIAIVDGVNNLGVILKYRNGTVTMLLTDEMEKVTGEDMSYLEPTKLWTVWDENLLAFMQDISEDPPVITYFAGAEYQWQDPIRFSADGFSLNLRLIEGWETQQVTDSNNSGIRCRPKGITDGWIYFSYWPDEYSPEEENRYINEGFRSNWAYYTSYPDSITSENGFDTRNAIWSYQRYDLESGDYAVINEGADVWFLEYEDQISDIITLSDFSAE